MKYILLFLPFSLFGQLSSSINSGAMIYNNGDNTVNVGSWSNKEVVYQFNKIPNEIATYLGARIGYLEEYDEQALNRANTIGAKAGVSDEVDYYAGFFMDYAWQRKHLMYGLEFQADLITIVKKLDFNMGWKLGMIDNTGFFNFNIGFKWQMEKRTKSKNY